MDLLADLGPTGVALRAHTTQLLALPGKQAVPPACDAASNVSTILPMVVPVFESSCCRL